MIATSFKSSFDSESKKICFVDSVLQFEHHFVQNEDSEDQSIVHYPISEFDQISNYKDFSIKMINYNVIFDD